MSNMFLLFPLALDQTSIKLFCRFDMALILMHAKLDARSRRCKESP